MLYPSIWPAARPVLPEFEPITSASLSYDDSTLLVVLTNRGQCKAYPFQELHFQELTLDEIAGQNFLLTYCGMTYSPVVFVSSSSVGVETLADSGTIHEANLVLRDGLTGSYWQQISGECLSGKLVGTRLRIWPCRFASLGELRASGLNALVMRPAERRRDAGRMLPSGVSESGNDEPDYPITRFAPLLPAKERVLGFLLDGQGVAVPLGLLSTGSVTGQAHGRTFRVVSELGFYRVEASSKHGWIRLDIQPCFWFAWQLLHPELLVWPMPNMQDNLPLPGRIIGRESRSVDHD